MKNPLEIAKSFVRAHYEMGWRIAPAWAVNYVLLTYVFVLLHWTSFLGVGTVFVGDVVALEINVWVFRRFGYPDTRQQSGMEFQPLRNIRQSQALRWLDIGAGKFPLKGGPTTLDIDPTTSPDVVGSVMRMDFEDETFDKVSALEILEHLHRHELVPALKEIKRVLKPGGRVVISIPNSTAAMSVPQALIWFVRERTTQRRYLANRYTHTHIGLVHPKQLKDLLKSLGFEIVHSERLMLYDYLIVAYKR